MGRRRNLLSEAITRQFCDIVFVEIQWREIQQLHDTLKQELVLMACWWCWEMSDVLQSDPEDNIVSNWWANCSASTRGRPLLQVRHTESTARIR